jgi:hypothetical protein
MPTDDGLGGAVIRCGGRLPAVSAAAVLACLVGIVGFLFVHNVSKEITVNDQIYIGKILESAGYDLSERSSERKFERQIELISAVQDAVLRASPRRVGIPINHPREPEDLYYAGHGLCFDRSRVIEKTLRLLGFDTRYAFVAETSAAGWPVASLAGSGVDSHAVVEVRTEKGWLIVDSVRRWISLNASGLPLSLKEWQNTQDKSNYAWHQDNKENIYHMMDGPFIFVYGLYSRHGGFYPPYTPFPDINWGEFALNLEQLL